MFCGSIFQGSLGLNSVSNFTILASDNPYGVFQISESFRPVQVDEQYKSKLITYFTLWGLLEYDESFKVI